MPNRRTVFFISDRTGITAEMFGNSLLSQFEDFDFQRQTIPFVDTPDKVDAVVRQVNETAMREIKPPIVFSSIVDEAMSATIRRDANALTLDLFQIFIAPLEAELEAKSSHAAGRTARHRQQPGLFRADGGDQLHAVARRRRRHARPREGAGDPGRRFPLRQDADLALPRAAVRDPRGEFPADARRFRRPQVAGVGACRTGTGCSASRSIPTGCTRSARSGGPDSKYAALENCRYEVRECEDLLAREGIPMLDTTAKSIEEIATTIVHRAKLRRHAY